VKIDAERMRVENGRAFGGSWLGTQAVDRLGLAELLRRLIEPGKTVASSPNLGILREIADDVGRPPRRSKIR